ncbi:hypothetical protein BC943DRAFT_83139 [Umbelopsis sp. AD052]|nr:hypothetical protein BC943DRAFT_83139 [Umbelopsis sp. AD052]
MGSSRDYGSWLVILLCDKFFFFLFYYFAPFKTTHSHLKHLTFPPFFVNSYLFLLYSSTISITIWLSKLTL